MKRAFILIAALAGFIAIPAQARDQIRIVGSSTIFPFTTAVAEEFGITTPFRTPVVESTGTGGGMKLFCAGVGTRHPDVTNASRRIKKSEVEKCVRNGVTDITEVKIGFDGIVLANSLKVPRTSFSLRHIFLGLAKQVPANETGATLQPNPYEKWSDIDSTLPKIKIKVLGPPPTSGSRDAFAELALEGGCKTFSDLKAMKNSDKNTYKVVCHSIREDGAYVEAGENDNLIIRKLEADTNAFGVFGFSFLDQNQDKVQGSLVNDVSPEFENIADGKYPVARSLYFYVKNAHMDIIPGIEAFVSEFTSDNAMGKDGYLIDKGLIPLGEDERKQQIEKLSM
ncbi:MAG: substrate-binding domain-containing protein [Alphaproteobacteria bacterium]|jgi:phosphate transport system substrate-binding protein|nr:substrate-binding domain-containing protein [Alphaproteobacteria bacterium]MDP7191199.1 substrate-binding domain-containing protein [Alphaproteobacteria bacterium]HJO89128.1 substrate-binding domain-containing protein [Alphaproteobacteria bacterium]|tara:strand:+ start:89 stop:1105 length:1017 start_codon:yes stop_codon:yes gene_type:complete